MAASSSQPREFAGQTTNPDAGHNVNNAGTHGHGGHGHSGGHGGAPVGHHFNNLLQQQSTVRFGMWMFLVTEVLFFGGAFCAYTAYRIWFPKEFEAGSAALNVGIASVNTFLLLLSSLTITLAVRACYVANRSMLKFWLGVTIILGSVFLALKMREYHLDYEEGIIPTGREIIINEKTQVFERMTDGSFQVREEIRPHAVSYFGHNVERVLKEQGYKTEGVNLYRVQLFFLFYYAMTGLHVLHMIIGIGLLGWQFTMAHYGFFKYPERYIYVEVMSLYWHFVDMVWMFLLPLLYFAGPHNLHQAVEQFKLALGMASLHG